MLCRACKREIPENSIYCNWCGEKQIRERKKKCEIKVPNPRQLKSGNWNIELAAEGQSVTEPTRDLCIARARAIRAGFLETKAKEKRSPITLGEAIDQYVDRRKNVWSPTTIRTAMNIRKNRLKAVMDKGLNQDWQAVMDDESSRLAPKTIHNEWTFIESVLKEQGCTIPNIRLPQLKKTERKWLDPDEIKLFCKALIGEEVEMEALLALLGMRRSEVLGLRWEDVDLEHNCIYVRRVKVPNENNEYVVRSKTKTVESTRVVPILIPRLAELLQDGGDGFISSQPPNGLWRRINEICQKAGVPEVGVHGLRHSFASLAYYLDYKEEECMRIGGWSDPKILHEIYTHLSAKNLNMKKDKMYEFYKNLDEKEEVASAEV